MQVRINKLHENYPSGTLMLFKQQSFYKTFNERPMCEILNEYFDSKNELLLENKAVFGPESENKSCSSLNFTPENTSVMSL